MNNLVQEIFFDINLNELKELVLALKENMLFKRMLGCSIQHRQNIEDPWNFIDGMEKLSIYKNVIEEDFCKINDRFIELELSHIIKKFNLYRSRIMVLEGKTNYTIHSDTHNRLHIPIFSNDEAFFYFPKYEKSFVLEEGKGYIVNTTEIHTFVNTSLKARVHFVGSIPKDCL